MGEKVSDIFTAEYRSWLIDLKDQIRKVQVKAALSVNAAMIGFYYELGEKISTKQTAWGSKFIERLSKDLKESFPDMKGFSPRNLKYIRNFYEFYHAAIGQQLVAQLNFDLLQQVPWGQNILIFTKARLGVDGCYTTTERV